MKMDFFTTLLLKYIQILLLIYLCASHSLVFALDCSEFEKKLILTQIEIEGLKKTNKNILLNELSTSQNIKTGELICLTKVTSGIENLRLLGIFSSLDHQIIELPNNNALLKILVQEKWTTIPILKISSGGGVSQYTLGIYDPNIFGQLLESGIQYENLAGASSGVIWLKNPRLLGLRKGLDIQYWNTRRIRIKYDQLANDPVITKAFLHHREKLFLEYNQEIKENLTFRFSFESNNDRFSREIIPDKILNQINTGQSLPTETKFLILRSGLDYGKIIGEAHNLTGQVFSSYFSYASPLQDSLKEFSNAELNYTFHTKNRFDQQLSQKLLMGMTSSNYIQYWHYLGGLDRIRGFVDNRFAGSQFLLSNSEIRKIFLETSDAKFQIASFVDILSIGESFSELNTLKAASVGVGIRLILPKVYRFVARLDFAQPIKKTDSNNWSFGVQQFF